jgi:hypothetical protein
MLGLAWRRSFWAEAQQEATGLLSHQQPKPRKTKGKRMSEQGIERDVDQPPEKLNIDDETSGFSRRSVIAGLSALLTVPIVGCGGSGGSSGGSSVDGTAGGGTGGGGAGGTNPPPTQSPPVANAGADQIVTAPTPVTLDGSASKTASGAVVSNYDWTITDRPPGSLSALNDRKLPSPSFKADEPGVYKAELVVTDTGTASPPSVVTINAREGLYTESTIVFRVVATSPLPGWGQEPAPGWPRAAPTKVAPGYRLYDVEIARDANARPVALHVFSFPNNPEYWTATEYAALRSSSTLYSATVDGSSAGLLARLAEAMESVFLTQPSPTRFVIEYSGHGSPFIFFENTLSMSDGREFVRLVRTKIGKQTLILDFSTNCNVGYFDFAVNFYDLADYLVASELIVGGYSIANTDFNAWLAVAHDNNLHAFLASGNSNGKSLQAITAARKAVWNVAQQSISSQQLKQSLSVFNLTEWMPFMRALKAHSAFNPTLGLATHGGNLGASVYASGDPALIAAYERFRFAYASTRELFTWTTNEAGFAVASPVSLRDHLSRLT